MFVSATPNVNDTLMGSANGEWVSWYITSRGPSLVIGYSPASRFAAELKTKPWYEVLRNPASASGAPTRGWIRKAR